MSKKDIIVIGGPTASGKTSFAIQIAQKIQGEIINADAIQVYQDLRILSARPTQKEQQDISHHLFGFVDAWSNYSVQNWLLDVAKVIPSIKHPIFVGGTGFYLDALINGISEVPDIPEDVRKTVRQMDIEEIKRKVKDTRFTDPQRLRRSFEVQLATGKSLSYFQQQPKKHIIDGNFKLVYLLPPREKIYARCERRLIQMLQQGMIEEVEKLQKLNPTGGVLKAIGVSDIIQMINGKINKEEMLNQVLLSTKHYAKRQMTWFRHQGHPDFIIEDPQSISIVEITK